MNICILSLIIISCLVVAYFLSKMLWKGVEFLFKFIFISIVTLILSGMFIYFFLYILQ